MSFSDNFSLFQLETKTKLLINNVGHIWLVADGNLHCGMYPAGKVAISRHLVTPGFPRCDHTIGKQTLAIIEMKYSRPQVILKCQPPICLDYRSAQTDPAYS